MVRIGQELPTNPQRARVIANWSLTIFLVAGIVVAGVVYLARHFVVGIFSTDPAVFEASRQIWPYVCLHLVFEYLLYAQSSIMRGLALQWRLALCLTVCLWGVLLPTLLWRAVRNSNGGLTTLWTLLPIGYACTNTVLRFSYANVNWNEKSREAQRKLQSRSTDFGLAEKASLLPQDTVDSVATS